jgi:NAD(P)-dependent dehydrogenase (short-subunit alcohol dehydrogenase family)
VSPKTQIQKNKNNKIKCTSKLRPNPNRRETRLDVLINNAGIMATPFALSPDGYEAQLQTNYLSHWLLTYHLTPLLLSTSSTPGINPGSVRIINVTSMGHAYAPKGGIQFSDMNQLSGGPWTRYGQSKLANILHARELARLYSPRGIWTAATHPGNVDTELSRNSAYIGMLSSIASPILRCLGVVITAPKAAATPVWAATSGELLSGSYLVPVAKLGKESKEAKDAELGKKLWSWTEEEMRAKGFLE